MVRVGKARIPVFHGSVVSTLFAGLTIMLVSAAWLRGEHARSQERSDLAAQREILTRAVEQGGAGLEAHLSLINLLLESGELDKAESVIRVAIERYPRSGRVYSAQGRLNLQRKDYSGALESFQRAVQLGGQDAEFVEALARAYYEKGMFEFRNRAYLESLADAKQALRLIPDRPPFLHLLGLSSYLLGQKTDARTALERAIELAPGQGSYRYDLAVLLLEMNEPKEAEAQLLQAVALDPGIPMAYVYLGRLQHNDKRTAEALASFRKARDLQPDLRGVHYHLGYSHKALGDDGKAIEEMMREIAAHPDFVPALTELGDLYLRIGEAAKANEYLERARRLDAKSARICYLLGKSLVDLNRGDEALAWLIEAARLAPDQPEPHYVLAQVYMRLGKAELAEEQLGLFREKRKRTGSPW